MGYSQGVDGVGIGRPVCTAHATAYVGVTIGATRGATKVVKEWLGHTSIATTLRYAHLAPQQLAQARDVLQDRAKTVTELAI